MSTTTDHRTHNTDRDAAYRNRHNTIWDDWPYIGPAMVTILTVGALVSAAMAFAERYFLP